MRTVYIKHLKLGVGIHAFEVEATTFGELQSELSDVPFTGYRVVLKETKADLVLMEAALPPDNFSLFFYAEKTKAGAIDDYEDYGFQELRGLCATREGVETNNGNYGTAVEMRTKLVKDDTFSSSPDIDPKIMLDNLVDYIIKEVELIKAAIDSGESSLMDEFSKNIEAEYERIKQLI